MFLKYTKAKVDNNLVLTACLLCNCKKVDDEFEHQIKMKLKKSMYNGYDQKHQSENGRSTQAWAVLNTDDENIKIIGQIVVWKEAK